MYICLSVCMYILIYFSKYSITLLVLTIKFLLSFFFTFFKFLVVVNTTDITNSTVPTPHSNTSKVKKEGK